MLVVSKTDAIIFPKRGNRSPRLGPVGVIVGTETDLSLLCSLLDFDKTKYQKLFISRLYVAGQPNAGFSLSGPLIGDIRSNGARNFDCLGCSQNSFFRLVRIHFRKG